MTDVHPLDDLVALALDDLTPEQRRRTLLHLDSCSSCRATYQGLAATVEQTLTAAPTVDPPTGFETRVLDALGVADPASRHVAGVVRLRRLVRNRWALAAAGVAAGIAIGVAGMALGDSDQSPGAAPTPSAPASQSSAPEAPAPGTLHTADGTGVGWVTRGFMGKRDVLVVSVHDGRVGARFTCRLGLRDGSWVESPHWQLKSPNATWVLDAPAAGVDKVEKVVLVANDGKGPVWSHAAL